MDNFGPALYLVTFVVVLLVGFYFVVLGAMAFIAPVRAKNFLLGFAGSPFKHYLELALRLIAGGSILVQAQYLVYTTVFIVFGWMLIVTTTGLLLIPWSWHRRFTEKAVPIAVGYLPLIGAASLALGLSLLFCLVQSRLTFSLGA